MVGAMQKLGFRRALVLNWGTKPLSYEISAESESLWRVDNVIYAWMDTALGRCLNVGHTGQTLRARFKHSAGYENWLNGLRKGDIDTPIRHKWLRVLATCQPSKVEIWIKTSSSDRGEREAEEHIWMEKLAPLLNQRGRTVSGGPDSVPVGSGDGSVMPRGGATTNPSAPRSAPSSTPAAQPVSPSPRRSLAAPGAGGGGARIDGLPHELRRACQQLCADIRGWPGVSETDADRYVGFSVSGQSLCQLHAKPTAGYVWVHVVKARYDSSLHFEDRGYLGGMTRFKFGRADELDDARRVCRTSYEGLK